MSYQLADIDAAKTEYKACKTEEEKAKWLTRRRESLEEVKKVCSVTFDVLHAFTMATVGRRLRPMVQGSSGSSFG